MNRLLKLLFTNKYKKLYEESNKKHVETLHELKNAAIELKALRSHDPVVSKYITIKNFEKENSEFVKKLATIHDSEELNFMLYDLKMQCIENMVNGNVDVNIQMTGVLKGIDLVLKNLIGYKGIWLKMIEEAQKNVG